MTNLFLGFLNRSLSAAVLIFAVVLVQLAFKKAPKWLLCALWALAAVRLLCPFSIECVLSLIPSAEPVQPEIVYSAAPAITSGIPAVDAIVNPPLQAAFTPDPVQTDADRCKFGVRNAWVTTRRLRDCLSCTRPFPRCLRLRVRGGAAGETCSVRNYQSFIFGVIQPEFICPSGSGPARRTWFWRLRRRHLKRGDQL